MLLGFFLIYNLCLKPKCFLWPFKVGILKLRCLAVPPYTMPVSILKCFCVLAFSSSGIKESLLVMEQISIISIQHYWCSIQSLHMNLNILQIFLAFFALNLTKTCQVSDPFKFFRLYFQHLPSIFWWGAVRVTPLSWTRCRKKPTLVK